MIYFNQMEQRVIESLFCNATWLLELADLHKQSRIHDVLIAVSDTVMNTYINIAFLESFNVPGIFELITAVNNLIVDCLFATVLAIRAGI